MQVGRNPLPHRIEDEIDPLVAGQLGGRNEIRVPGHQDDLVDLLLVRQRSDINADLHIDLGLAHIGLEMFIAEVAPLQGALTQLLIGVALELPLAALGKPTQAQRKFALKGDGASGASFVPFTAQSRMSGANLRDGTSIRKGASDAILRHVSQAASPDLERIAA